MFVAGFYVVLSSYFVYGFYMKKLSQKIVRLLRKKRLKISFAESCTGGLLSSTITSISGSSKVFSHWINCLFKSIQDKIFLRFQKKP